MFAAGRDHRVHELPRAVPVRRKPIRAETVEEDQVREVQHDFRDSESGIRTKTSRIRYGIDGFAA
jgi:hypothetical protein